MNTQVQVPMGLPQMNVPTQSSNFPSVLGIKNETCTSMIQLVRQYWWVLLLLVAAYLYYRHVQAKKQQAESEAESETATA